MSELFTPVHTRRLIAGVAATAAIGLALTACANGAEPAPSPPEVSKPAAEEVTLITHDSFPADLVEEAASNATGLDVRVVTSGDGGELTNSLVLSKGAPLADAFFGVDLVFASRLIEHDIATAYEPEIMPERAEQFIIRDGGTLVPIDIGATCVNIDTEWFSAQGIAEPEQYEDLIDPVYEGLSVIIDPATSSTGASFMTGTIAHFGEQGALEYWSDLVANGARVETGWNEAYHTQFSAGDGGGTFPIVVSYSSSPAYVPTTRALLDTCSSEVEFAGVLQGAANEQGAEAVVDFLLSREFQDLIAETMWVYPIDESAYIPEEWSTHAPLPTTPNDVPASDIGENRDRWLRLFSDALGV